MNKASNHEILVRPERPEDEDTIRQILISAFAAEEHSDHNEHFLVEALRQAKVLSVALVAESHGEVVGYIAFSKVKIDGQDMNWYGLAPLAVKPSFQKKGIGKLLVTEGLKLLTKNCDANGCVLLGHPEYYQRFNFKNFSNLKLEGVDPKYFMALPLKNPSQVPSGTVTYHSSFSVVSKS